MANTQEVITEAITSTISTIKNVTKKSNTLDAINIIVKYISPELRSRTVLNSKKTGTFYGAFYTLLQKFANIDHKEDLVEHVKQLISYIDKRSPKETNKIQFLLEAELLEKNNQLLKNIFEKILRCDTGAERNQFLSLLTNCNYNYNVVKKVYESVSEDVEKTKKFEIKSPNFVTKETFNKKTNTNSEEIGNLKEQTRERFLLKKNTLLQVISAFLTLNSQVSTSKTYSPNRNEQRKASSIIQFSNRTHAYISFLRSMEGENEFAYLSTGQDVSKDFEIKLDEILSDEERAEVIKYRVERKLRISNPNEEKNKYRKKLLCYASFTQFLKLPMFKNFEFPHAESDKCDLCEEAWKKLRAYWDLKSALARNGNLSEQQTKLMLALENEILLASFHKAEAKRAKEEFKKHVNGLENGDLVIILDFAQKIDLKSLVQVGTEFYKPTQLLLLSIVIKARNENGKIDTYKTFIISEFLRQDALTVITALNKLFKLDWFQTLCKGKLIVWSDGASHFKNFGFLGFFTDLVMKTSLLKNKEGIELLESSMNFPHSVSSTKVDFNEIMICNYFPGHGKGECDCAISFFKMIVSLVTNEGYEFRGVNDFYEKVRAKLEGWKKEKEMMNADVNYRKKSKKNPNPNKGDTHLKLLVLEETDFAKLEVKNNCKEIIQLEKKIEQLNKKNQSTQKSKQSKSKQSQLPKETSAISKRNRKNRKDSIFDYQVEEDENETPNVIDDDDDDDDYEEDERKQKTSKKTKDNVTDDFLGRKTKYVKKDNEKGKEYVYSSLFLKATQLKLNCCILIKNTHASAQIQQSALISSPKTYGNVGVTIEGKTSFSQKDFHVVPESRLSHKIAKVDISAKKTRNKKEKLEAMPKATYNNLILAKVISITGNPNLTKKDLTPQFLKETIPSFHADIQRTDFDQSTISSTQNPVIGGKNISTTKQFFELTNELKITNEVEVVRNLVTVFEEERSTQNVQSKRAKKKSSKTRTQNQPTTTPITQTRTRSAIQQISRTQVNRLFDESLVPVVDGKCDFSKAKELMTSAHFKEMDPFLILDGLSKLKNETWLSASLINIGSEALLQKNSEIAFISSDYCVSGTENILKRKIQGAMKNKVVNLIVIPFNPNNVHFTIFIYDKSNKNLIFIDPLGESEEKEIEPIENAFKQLNVHYKLKNFGGTQNDGKSCGLFVLKYIELLTKEIEPELLYKTKINNPTFLRKSYYNTIIQYLKTKLKNYTHNSILTTHMELFDYHHLQCQPISGNIDPNCFVCNWYNKSDHVTVGNSIFTRDAFETFNNNNNNNDINYNNNNNNNNNDNDNYLESNEANFVNSDDMDLSNDLEEITEEYNEEPEQVIEAVLEEPIQMIDDETVEYDDSFQIEEITKKVSKAPNKRKRNNEEIDLIQSFEHDHDEIPKNKKKQRLTTKKVSVPKVAKRGHGKATKLSTRSNSSLTKVSKSQNEPFDFTMPKNNIKLSKETNRKVPSVLNQTTNKKKRKDVKNKNVNNKSTKKQKTNKK